MKEIDEIESKLKNNKFHLFTHRVIDEVKRRNNIYQYDIAKEMDVPAITISYLKSYFRLKKYDKLLWDIIVKYNVDYYKIIESVNESIERGIKNEEKNMIANQFSRYIFIYDEITETLLKYRFDVNLYNSKVFINEINGENIYRGQLSRKNFDFTRVREKTSGILGEMRIFINGNNINNLIRENKIVSGLATETDNAVEGFGIRSILITPNELPAKFNNLVSYFFNVKKINSTFKFASLREFEEIIINHKKFNKEINVKLPKELITGYSQFLEYFSEYVKYSKGEDIVFNVKRMEDGLIIDLSSEELDLDIVGKYLHEYLDIAKQNIDNLKVNVETNLSETDFNLLVLDLKHQVTSLKHSLDIAQLRNAMLSSQVDHLKELSINFSQKESIIHTQFITGGDQQFADKIRNEK